MPQVETELKFLLEREAYYSLYRYLKLKGYRLHLTRQVNYYFAASRTSPALHLASTRIRYVRGRYELTCKIPINETTGDEAQNCYEYNADISCEKAFQYINQGLSVQAQRRLFGNMDQAHGIPMADLHCFGHLRTARFAFSIRKDLPALLLDSNAYLGTFDYELEWELKQIETANKLLQSLFRELGIQPVHQKIPKVKRFFDRLTAINLSKNNI
ncbi:MAG: CYTH domain-containing protein [Caldicoprobacterales bacterium]|jgi:uncharacterized protein YjbK|nr:CYTH domain-containing protein [Clostridiales bacterium]